MHFSRKLAPSIVIVVLTAQAGLVRRAGAQGSRTNPALAQALYDDARRLVDAGDYAAACPKFKASFELEPGGGTLLNLADCYEKQGKTALSWSTFKEALASAERDGRNERVAYANHHIQKLEARLAWLTVSIPAAAREPGVTVSVDGVPLSEAAWGVAVPVDPGEHSIRAEAPGKLPFERKLELGNEGGVREVVEIPVLDEAAVPKAAVDVDASTLPPPPAESGSTERTVGWIVSGVGIAGLVIGSYFGLRAFSRWDERNALCEGGCTKAAQTAGQEAEDAATLSTISVGTGVIALGVGAYLLLSAGGDAGSEVDARTALQLSVHTARGGAGLSMGSTW